MIDLLAVTGSGACGKYQHGWSDLDVFVIAEPDRTTELRQALTEVQSDLGEVKLGLTVLSQAEYRAGAVTSRLLHMMTLLGTGSLLPLWARPGLTIPAPPLADDVAASLEAGAHLHGAANSYFTPRQVVTFRMLDEVLHGRPPSDPTSGTVFERHYPA
ncbi:hypothetical protein [Streptomyces sioyaensis]|uniref:hypothetical protein n=1 Tax=Streptomyces sioyaensis TaxID=67364 RepID=UPI0037954609